MPNLPYYLRTNVPVFSVALNQRESFYIFPDKIFYIHNKNISAYEIAEVSFEVVLLTMSPMKQLLPAG